MDSPVTTNAELLSFKSQEHNSDSASTLVRDITPLGSFIPKSRIFYGVGSSTTRQPLPRPIKQRPNFRKDILFFSRPDQRQDFAEIGLLSVGHSVPRVRH